MNVIKIDISKNNDGGRFSKVYFAHGSHTLCLRQFLIMGFLDL